MTVNELLRGFDPVSPKAWKQKIQADLKGGDYNDLLTHMSPEGILIKPFYTEADREELQAVGTAVGSGPGKNWKIGCTLDLGQGAPALEAGLSALQSGVDHLLLRWENPSADWDGSLERLAGKGPVFWEWEALASPWQEWIPEACRPEATVLTDPIGHLAATGNWSIGMEADLKAALGLPGLSGGEPPAFGLMIRSEVYEAAGAHRVQELAYSLAHAHEYLLRSEAFPKAGSLLEKPYFKLTLGGDYFMDIAKIRALRALWKLLAREHGLSGNCYIIASPGLRNKTLYDYNTNMLRSTLECMSAVLGGADLVCNRPYDSLYNAPNAFGERIARNQLLLLKHEAHFDKVGNPADGSYYLETLTDQLGTKALELFKTLEKGGGLLAQLKSHQIQKKIRETAEKARRAVSEGQIELVGSTAFPNPEDRMSEVVAPHSAHKVRRGKTLIEPLPLRRLAAPYEQKRLRDESN